MRYFVFLSLVFFVGCGKSGDGLTKYPVKGSVRINGQPQAQVVVNFQHKDVTLPGRNARFPVGVTNAQGEFELSTNGAGDGAVPGEYTVTFEWLSANEASAYDRLKGAFSKPENTKFTAKVESAPTQLAPFEIVVPDSAIRPAPTNRPQP